jgi:hypothetical protein
MNSEEIIYVTLSISCLLLLCAMLHVDLIVKIEEVINRKINGVKKEEE